MKRLAISFPAFSSRLVALAASLGAFGALGISGSALAADPAQIDQGNKIYQYWCADCHGKGAGMMGPGSLPGTLALRFKYQGKEPPALEDRTDLDPAFVSTVVRLGIQAMPFFRKTEVSDSDLVAIAAYLGRNNPGAK